MVVRCCGEYFKMTAMPLQLVSSVLPLRYSRLSLDEGKEQRLLAVLTKLLNVRFTVIIMEQIKM